MHPIGQLAHGNVGSKNGSDSQESTGVSASREAELATMERLTRRVVKEEFEQLKAWIFNVMNHFFIQGFWNNTHHSEPRSLQLRFLNKFPQPVLTGRNISVEIDLVDVLTGEVVKFGPEASAKVEIVVLQVDHDTDETNDWTPEEFNKKIVREREGNKCLLRKHVFLTLKEGTGSVDTISFTQISKWMRKRRFRLGARMVDNFNGTRVKEARSEPFILKDNRGHWYEKHRCPSLNDDVWRLDNIRKGGSLHKRLSDGNIKTVQDFLTQFFINRQVLQNILGRGMPATKLDIAVKHGLTCKHDNKYLYHLPGSQQKTSIVLNDIRQVVGVVSECRYSPIDTLSQTEKAEAQKWAASALDHWGEVVPYDEIHENSLLFGSSCFANAQSLSNPPILDSPSGPNVDTAGMFSEYNTNQPSTSFPGFDVEDCSGFGIDFVGFDVEEQMGFHCIDGNTQGLNPSAESDPCWQTAKDGSLFANEKAQIRRWLKVSIALRFLLRKIKVYDHVQKKQRRHY